MLITTMTVTMNQCQAFSEVVEAQLQALIK